MAKVTKPVVTTAKYTESHDRLTLTVKFASGDKLRYNISRTRSSLSFAPQLTSEEVGKLGNMIQKLEKKLAFNKVMLTMKQKAESVNSLREFIA